jgi:ribonuclease HII
MSHTLSQLHQHLVVEARALDAAPEAMLLSDARRGAQEIFAAIVRRRFDSRSEGQRLRKMLRHETQQWNSGVQFVAGVDEAGISPLAGPVAAAAVILPQGARIAGVDDSKKLEAGAREHLAVEIKATALAWCVGFAEVAEIDSINIYWAGILAMRRAIEGLPQVPGHVLVDGRHVRDVAIPQQKIVGGDGRSQTIAAASFLAKTSWDALMHRLDRKFPGYGPCRHKGYPVKDHLAALKKLGATSIHRRSFGPVRQVLGLPPLPPWEKPTALRSLE